MGTAAARGVRSGARQAQGPNGGAAVRPDRDGPCASEPPWHSARRVRRARRRRAEAGSSTVEAVIMVPAAMVVILVAVQVCLWAVAAETVQSIAGRAAGVAAGVGGTVTAGQQAGEASARSLAGPVVTDPVVLVEPLGPNAVRAVVTGQVESILPWLHPSVRAVRDVGVQRFRIGP